MINYKLFTGVVDKRYLQQVCCLDNVGSGTQGAIWADTVHKQVSVINLYFGKTLNEIDWKRLSKNVSAVSILERNLDKIDWSILSCTYHFIVCMSIIGWTLF